MIRNKFAKFAKETESRISTLKINKKICIILAAVITLTSIGISTTKIGDAYNVVSVKAESSGSQINAAAQTLTSASNSSALNVENNKLYKKVTIIKHGGKPQVVFVRETTVKKALEASHTTVGKHDVVNTKLSAQVYDGMTIVIDEVKYKNKSVTKKISYNRFKKLYPEESTASLSKNGKVQVSKTLRVKYVNGKKAEEKVKSLSYKAVDVVNPTESVGYGKVQAGRSVKLSKGVKLYSQLNTISVLTPKKDFKLDKKGVPLNYSKKITGTASAYCCGTTTATGKSVKPGYIAVNPKQIPYGTKMYIRSSDGNWLYGYASAEDTGGFVSWGNTVADLYMSSYNDCVNFGRRSIEIYILD